MTRAIVLVLLLLASAARAQAPVHVSVPNDPTLTWALLATISVLATVIAYGGKQLLAAREADREYEKARILEVRAHEAALAVTYDRAMASQAETFKIQRDDFAKLILAEREDAKSERDFARVQAAADRAELRAVNEKVQQIFERLGSVAEGGPKRGTGT